MEVNFQCKKQKLQGKFPARESHTTTLLSDGKRILVFGGRAENEDVYNDVVVIDTGFFFIYVIINLRKIYHRTYCHLGSGPCTKE